MTGITWLMLISSSGWYLSAAQDAGPATQTEPLRPSIIGKQLDPLEDPLEPIVPLKPRTENDLRRLEGQAWWATGKLLEQRGDNRGAYEAYKKGVARDPQSLSLLQELTSAAFRLGEMEEGIKYALQTLELDPGDFRLLGRVAAIIATEEPSRAIELLERARKSPHLKPNTPSQISLLRDLGILYRETGQMKLAAECFAILFEARLEPEKFGLDDQQRKRLGADPEIDYERMGQVFLDAGNHELALKAFQKAQEQNRGGKGNHAYNLANLYLQTNKPEEALQELKVYFDAQRHTKGRAAYELLAKILTALNRQSELIPQLEELLKKDGKNTPLTVFLADQYVSADKFTEAETLYKSAIDRTADLSGYRGLALMYRKQDRIGELITTLGRALEQQKPNEPSQDLQQDLRTIISDDVLLGKVLAEGRKQIADEAMEVRFSSVFLLLRLAMQGHKYDDADAFFQAALKARKGAFVALIELYGEALFTDNQFGRAAKLYETGLAEMTLSPEQRVEFLCQLIRVYELDGNTQQAEAAHAKALELAPTHPYVHYLEGWMYSHAGQYEKALAAFERVLSRFGDNKALMKFVRSGISNVYVLQGDIPKGEAILEEMFKEDPNDPGLNNDLGYLWADQGKHLEQAEGMIRKALKADPGNSAYLDSLAWVLYKRGKYEEALVHMEQAIADRGATDATLFDHLGDIYERLQKLDKAVEAWKKAQTAAQAEKRPDAKFLSRLEEKLKSRAPTEGQPKPESPQNP